MTALDSPAPPALPVVGWYVHHHGAGHRTRAVEVSRSLEGRVALTGFGSMPAPQGWRGEWVELARDDEPGPKRDTTAGGTLHWAPVAPSGYADRMQALAAWVVGHRPSLLVVDCSVEVTLLGRLLGVPVAIVGMRGNRLDRPHRSAYDAAAALLVPWPSAVPEPGWPRGWRARTVHAGAFSRFDEHLAAQGVAPAPGAAAPGARASSGPGAPGGGRLHHGLVLWGSGGTDVTVEQVQGLTRALPGWQWRVVGTSVGGESLGADELWAALTTSDVVVCHAGQNAVAEVAAARRPAVVVAQDRPHEEQIATVRALSRARMAVGLDHWPRRASAWPALIDAAVERGGERWATWLDGRGAGRMADAVYELAAGARVGAR